MKPSRPRSTFLFISIMYFFGITFLITRSTTAQSQLPVSIDFTADKIAYIGYCGGGYNVCLMDIDGSNQTALTDVRPGPVSHPTWSPDGSQIAFGADSEIFTIDLSGLNVVRLTHNTCDDRLPTWSPIGDKIAFVSDCSGNWDVYVMDTDGSNPISLTNHPASDGYNGLTWSPDGTQIAFVTNREDSLFNNQSNNLEEDEIYVLSNVTDTTHRNEDLIYLTEGVDVCDVGEYYLNPAWSPDGTQIAFALGCGGGSYNIYLLEIGAVPQESGTPNYVNLTQTDTRNGVLGLNWSPDGGSIVFVSSPDTTDRYAGIYILDIGETLNNSSSEIMRLTDVDSPDADNYYADPVWFSNISG